MKAKQLVILLVFFAGAMSAQTAAVLDTTAKKTKWDKKFYFGLTFNNSWSTIKGANLPNDYFWKPSVGTSLRAEYYFTKNIGLSLGVQYQQKGSGIITPDKIKALGDPDSTYRGRIKLHALEFPISVVLRSNEVIRNTRFHGSIGISPMKNLQSTYVFYSVEDGFHLIENHKERYYQADMSLTASLGIDINAGNACIFQVHMYGTWGTKNVYNNDYYPNANGKTKVIGLRLGWLF